jgi:hypothetical protein
MRLSEPRNPVLNSLDWDPDPNCNKFLFSFFYHTVLIIRTFFLVGSVGLPAGASSGGASGRVVKNYHVTIQENPFF